MKRITSVILAILLVFPALASAAGDDPAAAQRTVIEQLYQGAYQQVFDQSTADMQTALGSADSLANLWTQIAQAYGAFQEITSAAAAQQEQSGYKVANITCTHALAVITYTVALDADGLLAGISVTGVQQDAPESTADTSLFVSEPILLRAGEADETEGLLTLPAGDGPFPAVIMMQGSGATDRNETAYSMAPFRDLAEGLAIAGVASIRYDKYPYAHADMLRGDPAYAAAFTIDEEYILDARAALSLLQADSRIGDIYLLGHSEGAMIIPRVMQTLGAENFTGGILLEGTPLDLWEIQYHQNLAILDSFSDSDREVALAAINEEAAKLPLLQTMTDEELQTTTFFSISAYYQMDQISVDAAQTAITLGKPLLITQGGKDWQITPADGLDAWHAALDGKLEADYRVYPDMTHLLFDLEDDSTGTPDDYQPGNTVSQALIDDIAAWILQ